MAIPTASIAQNDRETLHLFARLQQGYQLLGNILHSPDDDLVRSIIEMASNTNLRRKM